MDSVLRGNIVAEIEAAMAALHCRRAMLLPANPIRGRIIRGGKYFVGGVPLDKTEFARDPDYPRKSAEVLTLLSRPKIPVFLRSISKLSSRENTRPAHSGDELEHGIGICEAGSRADLEAWAECWKPEVLPAGGAEFFEALLKLRIPERRSQTPTDNPSNGGVLFLSGTTSLSARTFVRSARKRGMQVFALPAETNSDGNSNRAGRREIARKARGALESRGRVMLRVPAKPLRGPGAGRKIAEHLAAMACKVVSETPVAQVFAEGGATAAEFARQIGWTKLQVVRELAPGVVTLSATESGSVFFTIKPGSYLWPEEVLELAGGQPRSKPRKSTTRLSGW